MTQLCIVSQQWDLPSNRFSLLLPLPQRSKAEVVIVSMSIVTAWHDLDDATEEKTTHLHGKACKQTKNFFQPLKPEEADLKSCTEEDNRASFTHKVKSRGFNKLCIISYRVTGFFQIKLLTKVFFLQLIWLLLQTIKVLCCCCSVSNFPFSLHMVAVYNNFYSEIDCASLAQ